MQNVWLWSSAILHIQNTVKTKAYKNDKANQGEGIHNILPSSALFLFLRWPSGQTSLTVAPNFLLSPISQYQNDKPRFSRDIPIIHAPTGPQLCPFACASCFLFCCWIYTPSLPVLLYANTWRYGFCPLCTQIVCFYWVGQIVPLGFFHNVVQKSLNELYGQSSTFSVCFILIKQNIPTVTSYFFQILWLFIGISTVSILQKTFKLFFLIFILFYFFIYFY